MQKDGVRALGDSELLAMILRSGTKGMNVLEVSRELLNRAGSLSALISWTAPDFRRVKGIGDVRAMQLVVAFDVARRIREAATETAGLFKDAAAVFAHMAPRLDSLDGKTVYLVDPRFDDSGLFLRQVQDWFADHMPSVKTKLVEMSSVYTKDDPKTWEMIKANGDGAIIGVGH